MKRPISNWPQSEIETQLFLNVPILEWTTEWKRTLLELNCNDFQFGFGSNDFTGNIFPFVEHTYKN